MRMSGRWQHPRMLYRINVYIFKKCKTLALFRDRSHVIGIKQTRLDTNKVICRSPKGEVGQASFGTIQTILKKSAGQASLFSLFSQHDCSNVLFARIGDARMNLVCLPLQDTIEYERVVQPFLSTAFWSCSLHRPTSVAFSASPHSVSHVSRSDT